MLSIEDSDIFRSEYEDFTERITKITDLNEQKNLESLCKNLLMSVKKIDLAHKELGHNNRLLHNRESRLDLINLRKLIITKLEQNNV